MEIGRYSWKGRHYCFAWEAGLSRQRDTAHWITEEQPEFVLNQLKEFLSQ